MFFSLFYYGHCIERQTLPADMLRHSRNIDTVRTKILHCATKFGSCLVLGVLTAGLYSLAIKTTETAFFSAVKIRLGSGEFFF